MKIKDNDKISIKLIFKENGKEAENNVTTKQKPTDTSDNK